jgi:hypothetical protein
LKEVTMTNIRLRIEDASPAMTSGSFGVTFFAGAASMGGRASLNTKVLCRNGRSIPLNVEDV